MSEPSFTLRKRGWRCWKFRCFLHEFSYVAPRYSSRFHHNKFLECDTLFQTTFEKLLSICSAVVDCSLRCNEAAAVFSPLLFFAVFCSFFCFFLLFFAVFLLTSRLLYVFCFLWITSVQNLTGMWVFAKSPLPCLSSYACLKFVRGSTRPEFLRSSSEASL